MMRRTVFLTVLLCLVGAVPSLRARSLVIESFDASIQVYESGQVSVVETLRPRFQGSWNGIYRMIPIQYRTPQGLNYTLRLEVESIKDGSGASLRWKSSRVRHYRKLKIWVPGASDATKTVVIRYRVRNALRFFEQYDELYWNVTGDEWEVPIESASATFRLPKSVQGVRATAFTGGYGSREQAADIQASGHVIRFETLRPLRMKEGLTASAAWEPGVVHRPGAIEKVAAFFYSNLMLLIPFVLGFLSYKIWYHHGRDPRRLPVSARYDPPLGLTPAEMGTLIDGKPDMHDITSTVVDLAVRGYLRIDEREAGILGLSRKYAFNLLRYPSSGELKPHEKKVLDGIFDSGARSFADTDDLKNEFYKELPDIREMLYEELLDRRYYRKRPDRVRGIWLALAIALGIGLFFVLPFLSVRLGMSALTAFLAAGFTAPVLIVFAVLMPRRTAQGARALEDVLGFEEFLSRVDSDRFDRTILRPEMFEEYLPYAMALQVEEKWARAFEDIYKGSPEWYGGESIHSFRPLTLTDHMSGLASTTSRVMVSAPRSSGGSSFGGGGFSGGGGGFSGGGFGGGGGGGF